MDIGGPSNQNGAPGADYSGERSKNKEKGRKGEGGQQEAEKFIELYGYHE